MNIKVDTVLVLILGILCSCNNKLDQKDVSFRNIRICTEKISSINPGINRLLLMDINEMKSLSNTQFAERLRSNISSLDSIPDTSSLEGIENRFKAIYKEAAMLESNEWEYSNLKVTFLDGSDSLQERVSTVAREWEQHCSIRFSFGQFIEPDITIRMEGDIPDYSSFVGNESKKESPSMSLVGIENENDENFRSIVLHEFGHALGLIHEHQNPHFNFPWNEEVVYKYYWDNHQWDKDCVDMNIIYRYEFDQVNATEFDSLSIMIYHIPDGFLEDTSVSFDWTYEISERDIELIGNIYPKDSSLVNTTL